MSTNLRIGFVAWHALPAIVSNSSDEPQFGGRPNRTDGAEKSISTTRVPSGQTQVRGPHSYDQTFGGLETAMWTLARHMGKLPNIETHAFVAGSSGKSKGGRLHTSGYPESVNGVNLHVSIAPFRNLRHQVGECLDIPKFRLKKWSWDLIWQLPLLAVTHPFRQRDPIDCQPDPRLVNHKMDAWIAFGVTSASSRVVATALQQNVPSLVCVQSNAGLDERLASSTEFFNECGESSIARRYALLNASQIVCQSQWQLERLGERFERAGCLVRNPIDILRWKQPVADKRTTPSKHPYALWIGRYDDFHKRPLLMLEIARRCPEIQFRMIVNAFDKDIEQQVRLQCPDNVELVDRVPFEKMPHEFASARLFVSTGSPIHEGFPNVLLQSAASHTPIVSLSDHDGYLARSNAGVGCEESIDLFVSEIKTMWASPNIDWENVDKDLAEHHDADQIAQRTENFIREMIK